jgi:hypothetical protein
MIRIKSRYEINQRFKKMDKDKIETRFSFIKDEFDGTKKSSDKIKADKIEVRLYLKILFLIFFVIRQYFNSAI